MLKPASDGSGTGVDQIHGVNGGGAAGRARTEERRHPLKPKQQQDGFGTTEACLAAEPVSATNLPWIFISTWNVGGYTPTAELNLDDFIPADDHSDIYVLGDCPQDGNSR